MVKRVKVPKRYSLRLRAQRHALSPSMLHLQDMNDDCLVHIFNFLDIKSLMKVCKVGQRAKDIVIVRVIPLRTVNFTDISNVRKAFALFGRSMTRIIVHSDDMQLVYPENSHFDEFLRLILEHGAPGRLQQVNLTFGGNENGISAELPGVIGPFFENVHTLEFNLMNDHMEFFHQFMNAIPKENLRTLKIHNIQVIGDWLAATAMPRLKEIHLCVRWSAMQYLYPATADRIRMEERNELQLINFISNNPASLVRVDFDSSTQNRIFVEMSQRMPNIERLGTLMWWPGTNINNNSSLVHSQIYQEKWDHLSAFKNLKFISLQSYVLDCSDLGEVFRILAVQNTIEELALSLGWYTANGGNPVAVDDLRRLTRLKTLNLAFFSNQITREFLYKFFENLPALTKCTVSESYPGQKMKQASISNVVQLARKLTVLVIYCEIDSFTPRFYKKLLKIRTSINERNDMANRLTIFFSEIPIHGCIDKLGENYKPSIIALKTIDFKTNFC